MIRVITCLTKSRNNERTSIAMRRELAELDDVPGVFGGLEQRNDDTMCTSIQSAFDHPMLAIWKPYDRRNTAGCYRCDRLVHVRIADISMLRVYANP